MVNSKSGFKVRLVMFVGLYMLTNGLPVTAASVPQVVSQVKHADMPNSQSEKSFISEWLFNFNSFVVAASVLSPLGVLGLGHLVRGKYSGRTRKTLVKGSITNYPLIVPRPRKVLSKHPGISALAVHPETGEEMTISHSDMADELSKAGKFSLAEKALKRAIKEEPDNLDLHLKLMSVYVDANNDVQFRLSMTVYKELLRARQNPGWGKEKLAEPAAIQKVA